MHFAAGLGTGVVDGSTCGDSIAMPRTDVEHDE
jgi:hypothetical protein